MFKKKRVMFNYNGLKYVFRTRYKEFPICGLKERLFEIEHSEKINDLDIADGKISIQNRVNMIGVLSTLLVTIIGYLLTNNSFSFDIWSVLVFGIAVLFIVISFLYTKLVCENWVKDNIELSKTLKLEKEIILHLIEDKNNPKKNAYKKLTRHR